MTELSNKKTYLAVVESSVKSDTQISEKFDGQTSEPQTPANTKDDCRTDKCIMNSRIPNANYSSAVDAFKKMEALEQQSDIGLQIVQLAAMHAAYLVYYPFRNDETAWCSFLSELGITLKGQTRHVISPLLDCLFASSKSSACKSKKSMWSSSITHAAKNDIEPDKFKKFIQTSGGIAKSAKAARKLKLTKDDRLKAAEAAHEAELRFRARAPNLLLQTSQFVDSLSVGFNIVVVEKKASGKASILARLEDSSVTAHQKFLKLITKK
ncbi:hypothetical protein ACFQ14_08835 [Pseudahrensia aquimaris]|uniref:Uncharacterized protein n=1 Tax=Pseudahrensia aquimaris TaxID=744461 RepID=A0ABW3FEA1_9HYPH